MNNSTHRANPTCGHSAPLHELQIPNSNTAMPPPLAHPFDTEMPLTTEEFHQHLIMMIDEALEIVGELDEELEELFGSHGDDILCQ
jgi:hypothetical protein